MTKPTALVFVTLLVHAPLLAACSAGTDPPPATDSALWQEYDEDAVPADYAADVDEELVENETDPLVSVADPTNQDDDDLTDVLSPYRPQSNAQTDAAGFAVPLDGVACNRDTALDLVVYYEVDAEPLISRLKAEARACDKMKVMVPKLAASPAAGLSPTTNGSGLVFVANAATGTDALASALLNQLRPRNPSSARARLTGGAAQMRPTAEFHLGGSTKGNKWSPGWQNVHVERATHVGAAPTYTLTILDRSTKAIAAARIKTELHDLASWKAKGQLFRVWMSKEGYRPADAPGEIWHINEVPTTWANSDNWFNAIRSMTTGLALGDPEYDAATDPTFVAKANGDAATVSRNAQKGDIKGIVLFAGMGLPASQRNALRHAAFWTTLASTVQYFSPERYIGYPTLARACASQTLDAQTAEYQHTIFGFPETADAHPQELSHARAYLHGHYAPIVNAAWMDGTVPAERMADLASGEIYAMRSWYAAHDGYTPSEIGVYYRPLNAGGVVSGQVGTRVADALTAAFDGKDGKAIAACPGGEAACVCSHSDSGKVIDNCTGRSDGWYCSERTSYAAIKCGNGSIVLGTNCALATSTCTKQDQIGRASVNPSGELSCHP